MNTITRAGRDTGGYGKRRSGNGSPLFFVLLLCSGLRGEAQNRVLIARIARAAYEAFKK